tara:strand:- start:149 stop:382 length:234 start_codon:yes stop_codon:yes gene_type:complete
MHQDVEYEDLLDRYLDIYVYGFNDHVPHFILYLSLNMAKKIVPMALEYADDGSDPLDYTDPFDSSLDDIETFSQELY